VKRLGRRGNDAEDWESVLKGLKALREPYNQGASKYESSDLAGFVT
jgi:hypothetical protein